MSDLPAQIGRYQVQRLLGEGGMGVLYLALDPVLDRHVALKLLRVDSADLRRRFVREAQSAARIQHPNIVTVYDVGDHDGQLHIAMEYIDGDTLATLIRDQAPFSAIRRLDIIDDIADGLGFAHQRGIIHRDIKPANLMITRSGLVKVLDFGIARVAHRHTGEIEGPTLVGTPAYMAPEQLEGAEADARTDIYAVGLVTYELFSGRRAFAGATTADVLELVLAARPTPIEQLVPDIDPALGRVVSKAMARRPEERYQDLQAFRKDLARVRRSALAASADEATIVVGVPIPGLAAPPPLPVAHPTVPAENATARPRPSSSEVLPPTVQAGSPDETVYAPVAGRAATPQLPMDEGPLPIPLPPVPAGLPRGGAERSAGRATVDADVLAVARGVVSDPHARSSTTAADPPGTASSIPQMPAPGQTAPLVARRGVPAVATVAGLVVLLGLALVLAFAVVRFVGRASGRSLTASVGEWLSPSAPAADPTSVAHVPAPLDPGTHHQGPPPDPADAANAPVQERTGDVMSKTPADPPVPHPEAVAAAAPAPLHGPGPATARERQRETRPRVADDPPPALQEAAPRPTRTQHPAASPTVPSTGPGRERSVRDADADALPVVRDEPSRREPTASAPGPREEVLALVRGYVAARNTSHASGIRRVWPEVDDVHLRRVTSAFSAPLTLASCEVGTAGGGAAVATCHLTQPGTTGAYAAGQPLTIRRTFVFDVARRGRDWVIVGLRE